MADKTQLTIAELETLTQLLPRYRPGHPAIAALNQYDRRLDVSFDHLCAQTIGAPLVVESGDPKSFWNTTLDGLRAALCNDPTFQAKLDTYHLKPNNSALFTDLVRYLIGRSGMPLDPAMGILLLVYLLKVGLQGFCEV
jgi:hypothetical protein